MLDGAKLTLEAIAANAARQILIREDARDKYYNQIINVFSGDNIIVLPVRQFNKLSDTKTSQGVIAVCDIPKLPSKDTECVVALDGVQDPGNVGTIMRSAEAASVGLVLCSNACADAYSTKAVRASMGSAFRVPVERVDGFAARLTEYRLRRHTIIASDMQGSPVHEFKQTLRLPWVLVVGSEGNGISREVRDVCGAFVSIPMMGRGESLNAAVAASVLMFALRGMV